MLNEEVSFEVTRRSCGTKEDDTEALCYTAQANLIISYLKTH